MAFRGWPADAIEFFEGLEADNSRAYWVDHKDTYDRLVKGPTEELLRELEPEFGPGKLFRPYRDVRFSKDKTPYKTNLAAMVGPTGYVSLSTQGLGVGSGMYHLAPDQLERYRQAVATDQTGAELEGIAAELKRSGHDLVGHDALKTAPKGYAKDHPRLDLLRWKGVAAFRMWSPAAWFGTRKAKDRIVEALRAGVPLARWLDANVGASQLEPRR
ncbi:MAG: DUF2461 domain-containing protein [Acidimicrobiales bacterium]